MNLHAISALDLETKGLPGPSFLLRMADRPELLPCIHDGKNVVEKLDLTFDDVAESFGSVQAPSQYHAIRILEFARSCTAPHFVAQCQAGVGRSHAVIAALMEIAGRDSSPVIRRGTYNRLLYRLILEADNRIISPDPLIALAVRVKYPVDRLQLFMLSMQRQRYTNWQIVFVTDGPNPAAVQAVGSRDSRFMIVETPMARGYWGNPYRQTGLEICCQSAGYVGLSNDDNYYVPGYLEQMLFALKSEKADLVLCPILHSYSGWGITSPGSDLGCWIAESQLASRVRWPGNHFTSDQEYIYRLKQAARKVVTLDRPLFVHN